MNNIDTILDMLDWNSSPEMQQEGIHMASNVGCLKAFFQPISPYYHKNVWANCAKVVANHSDSELVPYLVDMLLWIEDLNWPGADIILRRLQNFSDIPLLASVINKAVIAIAAVGDSVWLSNIAQLLCNQKLKEQLSCESIQMLLEFE